MFERENNASCLSKATYSPASDNAVLMYLFRLPGRGIFWQGCSIWGKRRIFIYSGVNIL